MKKKLGPLPLWQWLVAGAGIGVAYYIYKARQAAAAQSAQDATASTTGTGSFGPVDPTTGLPYAFEGASFQATANTPTQNNGGASNVQQELADLQAIGQIFGITFGPTPRHHHHQHPPVFPPKPGVVGNKIGPGTKGPAPVDVVPKPAALVPKP